MMMFIALSSELFTVSWFPSIIRIDIFSLTVSPQMTFQSTNSLENIEAEMIDWLSLVSLFNGISAFVGYLMPKQLS